MVVAFVFVLDLLNDLKQLYVTFYAEEYSIYRERFHSTCRIIVSSIIIVSCVLCVFALSELGWLAPDKGMRRGQ